MILPYEEEKLGGDMHDTLEEIVELQKQYSAKNSPAMARRGVLIRQVLRDELRGMSTKLRAALRPYGDDADAEGRDGTGTKSHVPWTRWFSASRSPSAQLGWYVVYLVHPDGSGVSLCLSHGSTETVDGNWVQRRDEEVEYLMTWASQVVGNEFVGDSKVRRGISLGNVGYSEAYERTTVFSKFYAAGQVPTDANLEADLLRFMIPLKKLYEAQEKGTAPGAKSPDLIDLQAEIEKVITPLKPLLPKGQGRGLTAPLRKAVEMHAMALAEQWLKDNGFEYKNVSATHSCDYTATRGGEEYVIEVKGTTGGAGSILLTRNEVALHTSRYPKNVLIIVHEIELDHTTARTSKGELIAEFPWKLDEERLQPICYEYRF